MVAWLKYVVTMSRVPRSQRLALLSLVNLRGQKKAMVGEFEYEARKLVRLFGSLSACTTWRRPLGGGGELNSRSHHQPSSPSPFFSSRGRASFSSLATTSWSSAFFTPYLDLPPLYCPLYRPRICSPAPVTFGSLGSLGSSVRVSLFSSTHLLFRPVSHANTTASPASVSVQHASAPSYGISPASLAPLSPLADCCTTIPSPFGLLPAISPDSSQDATL